MKKQFAVAIAAILLLFVLLVPPVMSGLEDEPAEMSPSVAYLIINSDPQGADIFIDGEHVGKTPNNIPIVDLERHSLRLELEGYIDLDEERTFQFEPGEVEKEMLINLCEPGPDEAAVPHLPKAKPHAKPHVSEPGFLAITFILAILCVYLISKKRHR